jgi:hypothetical protein
MYRARDEKNSYGIGNRDHDDENYNGYLYKLICEVFIDIYRTLITNISSNTFLSIQKNETNHEKNYQKNENHDIGTCQYPLSLLQAIEELEFIKVIFIFNYLCTFIPYFMKKKLRVCFDLMG